MFTYNTSLRLIFIAFVLTLGLTVNLKSEQENNLEEKYSETVDRIINEVMNDTTSFERLSYFCDSFGPRLCGSDNLEKALDWVYLEMKKDGLENVKKEEVMVPHWVRGNEHLELLAPWKQNMPLLALGGSIATPKEGIESEVYVCSSFEELNANASKANGKVVVFDYVFKNYGQAVQFRVHGAEKAAKAGAVACLIRSVSPVGLKKTHTGMMVYNDSFPKIPIAAITAEDAAMLHRMQTRGQNPKIKLYMEAKTLPDALSYNVMSELKGSLEPDVIIALGGHSDSWDAGTGAHDDASGCFTSWEVIKVLKKLGIKPKKTLRSVFWANEENGARGGKAYAEAHKNEKHALVFEFDAGTFTPSRFGFSTSDSLQFEKVKKFESLLKKISKIEITKGGGGVDIGPMQRLGVPGVGMGTDDQGKYFWYHHAHTDTIDNIDPKHYRQCVAAIAVFIYLFSEM